MPVRVTSPSALLLGVAVLVAALGAGAEELEGRAVRVESRWHSPDLIVTEVELEDPITGDRVIVTQPGGAVDGIGMAFSHQPAIALGDRVRARRGSDGRLAAVAVLGGNWQLQEDSGTATYGVQRTSGSQTPVWHVDGCVHFEIDAGGTEQLPGDRELQLIEDALATWSDGAAGCGGLVATSSRRNDVISARDGRSTVLFRERHWCRPAAGDDPEVCHAPDASATTRLIFVDNPASPDDGRILEADIELNAHGFVFADGSVAGTVDLLSVATHEFGHALGLTHTCATELEAAPLDLAGDPVPSCAALSADSEMLRATMALDVLPGEINKRTLEAADIAGICAMTADLECARRDAVVSASCAAAGGKGSIGTALGALLALLLIGRRAQRVRGSTGS